MLLDFGKNRLVGFSYWTAVLKLGHGLKSNRLDLHSGESKAFRMEAVI